MQKIYKKILLLMLSVVTILSIGNSAYAEQLPRPSFVSLNLLEDNNGNYSKFMLSWKNGNKIQEKILNGDKVGYEIDFQKNSESWISDSKLPLLLGSVSQANIVQEQVEISSSNLAYLKDLDIFQNNYSFRIRYVINEQKGPFSKAVRVGIRPGYANSSQWSEMELSQASKNGFISPEISDNMKAQLTRREFSDILVRVYEKAQKLHVVAGDKVYKDTDDLSVLKATKLGIVEGVGGNYFKPDTNITRQEMATMLTRFLIAMEQSVDSPDMTNLFKDHAKISKWAVEPVYQLQAFGLVEGDQYHNFLPKNQATREQGVALGQRAFELVENNN